MTADSDSTTHGKTLKELQALAKTRGLRGYSKLKKEQLIERLTSGAEPAAASAAKTGAAASREREAATPSKDVNVAAPPQQPTAETKPSLTTPASEPPPAAIHASATPIDPTPTVAWADRAKFALRPNGNAVGESGADLDEDIDRLPSLNEPMVCLLPQKPGVLHAYWVLPPAETAGVDYRLRLCLGTEHAFQVSEEIGARAPHGSWYFHVAEHADNAAMLVQLGHYRDGRFVLARGRSIARVPSLYASSRTDDRWWVSDADFMRMYFRAGGFATETRFGWLASIGSPGAPPPAGEQHLAWPGAVSSRSS